VVQPVAFVVFLVSMIAETGRAPFDVAEGESEIVAGYHLEYSAMRFGLYYMGEYAHIMIASIIIATLFLGGYSIPFVSTDCLRAHVNVALFLVLAGAALALIAFQIKLRHWKSIYPSFNATDTKARLTEYSFLQVTTGLATLGVIGLAAVALIALHPSVLSTVDGVGYFAPWVTLATAGVQVAVLIAKAFLFCWIWIWVRWTLPRFRYDQIMSLGWKILLNVALVNLVVTALIAKLIVGGR